MAARGVPPALPTFLDLDRGGPTLTQTLTWGAPDLDPDLDWGAPTLTWTLTRGPPDLDLDFDLGGPLDLDQGAPLWTDRNTENITIPQTSFAGGNDDKWDKETWYWY